MEYSVRLYTSGETLPEMSSDNFFHSPEFFHILEKTPGESPYMAVITDTEGRVVAHILAFLHRRGSLLPPYLYTLGRIYGEGEYADGVDQERLFGMMIGAFSRKFRYHLCFYTELSDLSKKMYGYKYMRQNGFFPIPWQEVHNSLHSLPPRERLSQKQLEKIDKLTRMGVVTREAENEGEVRQFYQLTKAYYRMRLRKVMPPLERMLQLYHSDSIKFFVTFYKGKLIGGCLCAFTMGKAYLWHLASKRKSRRPLRPDMMTVWYAIQWAWKHNYAHFCFLDVGLPYSQNPYRQFILSFGGKPVAKYRWFKIHISWLNKLASWFYRM